MKYNEEVFLENYINDYSVLGEDATAIYEEIFSAVSGKPIRLGSLEKIINEMNALPTAEAGFYKMDPALKDTAKALAQDISPTEVGLVGAGSKAEAVKKIFGADAEMAQKIMSDPKNLSLFDKTLTTLNPDALPPDALVKGGLGAKTSLFDKVAKAINPDYSLNVATLEKLKAKPGFLESLGGFFANIGAKIKAFFGGLKGKSLSEILSGGISWIKNPAVYPKLLGSSIGIVLITMIIRALKKRGQLKKYKNLQAIEQNMAVKTECFETDRQRLAYEDLIEECQDNKALRDYMFNYEEKKSFKKSSHFDY